MTFHNNINHYKDSLKLTLLNRSGI